MPVSVIAAALAMAWPRSRTRTQRLLGSEHPGQGGGGELADAVSGDDVGGGPEDLGDARVPAATSRGCATEVSRISSASAVVP